MAKKQMNLVAKIDDGNEIWSDVQDYENLELLKANDAG